MSEFNGCTSVKDLWIEQNLRNGQHGQTLAPVAIFPGAIVPAGRRVVMVQNLDGTTETELEWLERQVADFPVIKKSARPVTCFDEDNDYWLTVHDASVYGQ